MTVVARTYKKSLTGNRESWNELTHGTFADAVLCARRVKAWLNHHREYGTRIQVYVYFDALEEEREVDHYDDWTIEALVQRCGTVTTMPRGGYYLPSRGYFD